TEAHHGAASILDLRSGRMSVPSWLSVRYGDLPDPSPVAPPFKRAPRVGLSSPRRREGANPVRGGPGPSMSVTVSQESTPATEKKGEPLIKLEGVKKWFKLTRG